MEARIIAHILCFLLLILICNGDDFPCSFDIPHGQVSAGCRYTGIDLCTYSCDEGYEEQVSWIGCTTSGKWIPRWGVWSFSGPLCQPKTCPSQIPNGAFTNPCNHTVGSSCGYTCNTGYGSNSHIDRITCMTSTNWSVNPHSLCTDGNQCPYEIAGGDLNVSCRRRPGDTCTYNCRESYRSSYTSRTITCGTGLAWDKPLSSVCQEITCPALIPGGHIVSGCSRHYKNYCYFECNTGYIKAPASSGLTCNASGEWQNTPRDEKPCILESMLCPSSINNGQIVWHCSRQPGQSCTYDCNTGCIRDTSHSWLHCGSNGTWDINTDRLCTNCPSITTRSSRCPSDIPGGQIEYSCDRRPYSYCGFTCNSDCYSSISTASSLYCRGDASWDFFSSPCVCYNSPPTDGVDSSSSSGTGKSTGVIVGIVMTVIVTVFIVIIVIFIRYRVAAKRSALNAPRAGVRITYPGTATSRNGGATNGFSSPEYNHSSVDIILTNQYTSLQHPPNRGLEGPYSELQTSSRGQEFVNIQEPPEYSTLAPITDVTQPTEPPPSYEEITAHPSEYKV